MEQQKRLAVIVGARPNFVKAAPFLREAARHPDIACTVIHTGQHYDPHMSQVFFEEMGIGEPDIRLDIKAEFHTEKIGKMFSALRQQFIEQAFDAAVVFGDVNSTLAGGVAASGRTRLIHIEAGLRSHDRRMPEEINRVIVDHLSDLLFVTEPAGKENLLREGIPSERIHEVGNLMIESLEMLRSRIEGASTITDVGVSPQEFVVVTVHRQENTDSPNILKQILTLLQRVRQDVAVVFPLHPGTRQKIQQYHLAHLMEGLHIVEPLGYIDFLHLVMHSKGVITDSGGIQEETTHLGVPCCTLRDNTERPVTIVFGSNKLFSVDDPIGWEGIKAHLNRTDFIPRNVPLWDNQVSQRIFNVLRPWLGI